MSSAPLDPDPDPDPDRGVRRSALPVALRDAARWTRLGGADVPSLLIVPESEAPVPIMLWMHGRTVNKELDPGRYLRWFRAGIATCAVDLPGHGERFDDALQNQEATLAVVEQMVDEIDHVVESLRPIDGIDVNRVGVGGMSAGGMAALARLCRPHRFRCASVEGTSGSWRWQRHRPMWDEERAAALDPVIHLDQWRPIPFQAIHAAHDEWVAVDGQREFIDALRARTPDPELIDFVVFEERTGAPFEHAGFGRFSAAAKDAQLAWLTRWLVS